tara:strand:+ start:130261 stop:131550 length:1290 start_codon:yes stop_codon:yes gene_type:complete
MKMKKFILSLTLASTLFFGGEAIALDKSQSTDSVVAVVSGSVITQNDLEQRFELIKRQIRQDIPKDQVASIYKKTLNDLVNEEVQRQYAKAQGIEVSEGEIELAIAEIENRNKMSHGAFFSLAHGLVDSAKAKVAAGILRQKIVDRKLRPRVVVSKGEVDRLLAGINNGKNNWEKEVYQIFIEHSKDISDKEMKARIDSIYADFADKKTDFHDLAKAFSEDPSAKAGKGGLLGWYGAGELAPALDEQLIKLQKGEISKAVATPNGWHILYISNVKETEPFSTDPIKEYELYKYEIDLNEVEDKKEAYKQFKKEVAAMERLGDMEEQALRHIGNDAYNTSANIGWTSLQALPLEAKEEIESMDINQVSDIIEIDDVATVYYLSDKRDVLPKKLQEYRNRLQGRIMQNRLELAAKRFIRDLRRQAYIEIRI